MGKQMRWQLLQLTIVVWMSLVVAVSAADAVEKLWDAKADFVAAEQALDQEYQKAREALSDADRDALRKEQQDWIDYREMRSIEVIRLEASSTPEDGEESVPVYWEMMTKLTEERVIMVRAWRDKRIHKTLTGYYADDHGGKMMIVQHDDKLHFVLEVVRSATCHDGRMIGVAVIDGKVARYGDQAKEDELSVTFTSGGRRLKVSTSNTAEHHGARAYFDGEYLRVGDLTAEQANAVLTGKASPLGIDGEPSPLVVAQ